ncbi:hypothetical protein CDSE_0408 [Candidatus Kinetoplastibacterium desouzaii TCC079E]|uniref:Uncharacterized protein n=1 Tax=Candidatus Kinetoplastidibacterium desouzai TCC079E TaxID=1208919 RepID=M1L1W4_9PROT|nr:hypothetical protein CDSE_0408 [Candidatus Kinetoplastibacterium desouzaii TCC079E]
MISSIINVYVGYKSVNIQCNKLKAIYNLQHKYCDFIEELLEDGNYNLEHIVSDMYITLYHLN